jgi:hypothetical protein
VWGLSNVDELIVNDGGCVVASVKIENGSKGKPGQVIEVVVCWSQRMLLVVRLARLQRRVSKKQEYGDEQDEQRFDCQLKSESCRYGEDGTHDLFLWFGDLRFELTKRTDFDRLRGKGRSRQRERD